jgi:GH15 family glucan-1,4-alpha-glucosidase
LHQHATRQTHPRLQVLYDMNGEARVPERELGELEGYAGSRPVRVGNEAWRQRQLDVYGEVIRAAHLYLEHGYQLDRGQRRALAGLARAVEGEWQRPDHGLWERRGPPRHHTHSKVLCWAAANCLLAMAEGDRRVPLDIPATERMRKAIRAAIEQRALDPATGGYRAAFDADEVDASLLLLPRYGYAGAACPAMRATFARIERELARGELVWRYRAGSDGLEGAENAFGICGFWAVDYLAQAGRVDEARSRFERLLAHANDVGLYGEQMDGRTGEPCGNFPQAFTHVGLVLAATALAEAEARRGR